MNNDVVKMLGEQWTKFLASVQHAVTDGEKTAERVKVRVTGVADFWEAVRTNL